MRWDRRGDRPNLIQGSGIALIPGRGNSLTLAQLGLAANEPVDLALVDIHLSDGPTGINLGRELGQDMGVSVLFMTANPGMVRDGVAGTIGVLSKPTDEHAVQTAVDYALRRRQGQPVDYAPPGLQLFA